MAVKTERGTVLDRDLPQGQLYRSLYLNHAFLAALGAMREACAQASVSPISAALRWPVHHSMLRGEAGGGGHPGGPLPGSPDPEPCPRGPGARAHRPAIRATQAAAE